MKNWAAIVSLIGAVLASGGADAKSRIVSRGPFAFACVSDGAPAKLTVTFLGANANRARLVYKGKNVIASHALSADGARYEAQDVEFWNKGDDGVLEWGDEQAKCSLDK